MHYARSIKEPEGTLFTLFKPCKFGLLDFSCMRLFSELRSQGLGVEGFKVHGSTSSVCAYINKYRIK